MHLRQNVDVLEVVEVEVEVQTKAGGFSCCVICRYSYSSSACIYAKNDIIYRSHGLSDRRIEKSRYEEIFQNRIRFSGLIRTITTPSLRTQQSMRLWSSHVVVLGSFAVMQSRSRNHAKVTAVSMFARRLSC